MSTNVSAKTKETRARNMASICLELAAESEKKGDRVDADRWRSKTAECLRVAAIYAGEDG